MLADEPPDPAAEGETGDAGGRDHAAGGGESEHAGFPVEIGPAGATAHSCHAPLGIDPDAAHELEVERHAAVGQGVSCDIVAAVLDRKLELVLPREGDR